MPSVIHLEVDEAKDSCLSFRVMNAEGQQAVSQGFWFIDSPCCPAFHKRRFESRNAARGIQIKGR